MRETHRYDNHGGGNLVPITGKSTTIARTFNHLVSLIQGLKET